jgi:hypothetical protein
MDALPLVKNKDFPTRRQPASNLMSEPADIAARTQRFNESVRAFTPPSPSRHAKLMPFKDGIVELRQKGASLQMIRVLLATVNVEVGTDTIGKFLAEVNGESAPQSRPKRRNRARAGTPGTTRGQPAVAPSPTGRASQPPPPPQPSSPAPVVAPPATSVTEQLRSRGPRIADPNNL